MKILLLKQNPDPFVKRLSPGATCFLSSSVSLSLSQIRNTPQGDVPPGDKSLFLIPHVGIVASFQGKARDLMRLRSALNHLLSPPPLFLIFLPSSTPWVDRKSSNRGSATNRVSFSTIRQPSSSSSSSKSVFVRWTPMIT